MGKKNKRNIQMKTGKKCCEMKNGENINQLLNKWKLTLRKYPPVLENFQKKYRH